LFSPEQNRIRVRLIGGSTTLALIGIGGGVLSMSEPIPCNFAKLCFIGSALLLLLGVTYDLTASRLSRKWKMAKQHI